MVTDNVGTIKEEVDGSDLDDEPEEEGGESSIQLTVINGVFITTPTSTLWDLVLGVESKCSNTPPSSSCILITGKSFGLSSFLITSFLTSLKFNKLELGIESGGGLVLTFGEETGDVDGELLREGMFILGIVIVLLGWSRLSFITFGELLDESLIQWKNPLGSDPELSELLLSADMLIENSDSVSSVVFSWVDDSELVFTCLWWWWYLLGVGKGEGMGVGMGVGNSVIGERQRYCSEGTSRVIEGPDDCETPTCPWTYKRKYKNLICISYILLKAY